MYGERGTVCTNIVARTRTEGQKSSFLCTYIFNEWPLTKNNLLINLENL